MNIIKVEITWEDGTTDIVQGKLIPDVQGIGLEPIVEPVAPVEATPVNNAETPNE